MTLPLRRDSRRRRRRLVLRGLVLLVGAAVVFGVGLALGEALHDNPKPGGAQTLVRTLKPLPLSPVTVTVRKPRP